MNLAHLTTQPAPIPYHVYAAVLAVLIGGWQLYAEKGTRRHTYLGYIWVSLMLFVGVSSFWIHTLQMVGIFSPIHVLSVLVLWVLFLAVRAARNKNIKKHKLMMKILYGLGLIVTGLFTFAPGRILFNTVFG